MKLKSSGGATYMLGQVKSSQVRAPCCVWLQSGPVSVVVEEESRSVSLYYNGQIKKGWGGVGCGVGLGWVGLGFMTK